MSLSITGCMRLWGVATVLISHVTADSSLSQAAKTFSEVAESIQKNYVKEVPTEKLLEGALKGMLESLDDYSTFLNEDEFKQIRSQINGEFGGIGIEFMLRRGRLIITQVLPGSPAENEGLEAGDIILKVNGRNLVNLTSTEVMGLLKGKNGTKVTLTIRRGAADVFETEIVRSTIKIMPVETKIRNNVGILRIPSFISQNTTNDIRKALQKLMVKTPKLDALVIDLRDNSGGLLDQAIEAASLFVPKGTVTYTQGRTEESKEVYKVNSSQTMNIGMHVVLLVNSETASSAEIFAAALREHNYAIIVGEKTHGKGSVQVVSPTNHNSALKLTIAYYYTPQGKKIDHEGITPDIPIAQPKVTFSGESSGVKSRILKIDSEQKVTDTTDQEPGQELAQDPQLYQAIFIAKGLRFSPQKSSAP